MTNTDRHSGKTAGRILAVLAAGLLGACSTTPFMPDPLDSPGSLDNLQTKTADQVTVSTALLDDDQARRHFGVDLGDGDVQALWVRVRNATNRRYWFVRNAVDPDVCLRTHLPLANTAIAPLHSIFCQPKLCLAISRWSFC